VEPERFERFTIKEEGIEVRVVPVTTLLS